MPIYVPTAEAMRTPARVRQCILTLTPCSCSPGSRTPHGKWLASSSCQIDLRSLAWISCHINRFQRFPRKGVTWKSFLKQ